MVQVNGGDEITPDDAMSDCIDPGKLTSLLSTYLSVCSCIIIMAVINGQGISVAQRFQKSYIPVLKVGSNYLNQVTTVMRRKIKGAV